MIGIKDYENTFTVLQSEKAVILIKELLQSSAPAEDLLKDIDLTDIPRFDTLATTKEAKALKKQMEENYEVELTKKLLEKHGMIKLLQNQTKNNLQKITPTLLIKFGALLFKYKENEKYSEELYEKRYNELMDYTIAQIKELDIKGVTEDFLLHGLSGMINTFQISTTVKA